MLALISGETSSVISADLLTALDTAFKGVQGGVTDIIGKALPPALAIMALIVALRVGIRFFKSAAK